LSLLRHWAKPAGVLMVRIAAAPILAKSPECRFPPRPYIAHIRGRRRYQGDAAALMMIDLVPDPFGAGARFAEAATAEEKPNAPIARRWQLILSTPG